MPRKPAKSGQAVRTVSKKRPSKKAGSENWLMKILAMFASAFRLLVMLMVRRPGFLLLAFTLVLGGYVLQSLEMQSIWPVKAVTVEGEFKFLNKDQLHQDALPLVKGGLFSVDLPYLRHSLMKMPWVEDVSIRRQWPDTLLIRVIEKQPVVYWGDKAVVSAKGDLFVPDTELDLVMPKLNGPDGQHQLMLKELAKMQAWLLDTNLEIYSMTLDARRSWTLGLTGGLEIRLGRKQTHERLNRFVSVYKSNLEKKNQRIKHIDMRYTNGFALAWKEA